MEEKNLPSPAAAVHEEIRQEGEKELERDSLTLWWSALAAGLSMGASLMAKGIFHARLPEGAVGFFVENLGYTIGFVIVIMARQQPFTENTLTAVLPFMHKPTRHNFAILMRLWGVVLVGNLIGTALMAFAFLHLSVFDIATRAAFITLSQEVMTNTPGEMFCNAIISGWIITSRCWMIPSAKYNRLLIITIITYLMGIGNLTHIVVGSVVYLVFNDDIPWWQFFYPFALLTMVGNIVGGTFNFRFDKPCPNTQRLEPSPADGDRLRGWRQSRDAPGTDRVTCAMSYGDKSGTQSAPARGKPCSACCDDTATPNTNHTGLFPALPGADAASRLWGSPHEANSAAV